MKMKQKLINNQVVIFSISLLIFITAAILGWVKLRYGFNFIDEGWQMTESWRLISGDHFLEDSITGALRMYTLFNAFIFKILPDITLLGFRRLQYIVTIFALVVFSAALYKADKEYWYQPVIFSVFVFTGLDPAGMISNMNYFTYPHLFLVLHISFLILGLYQNKCYLRRAMLLMSGVSLWCISFSLLHTSVVAVSPFLLLFVHKRLKIKSFSYTLNDLFYVSCPFFIFWFLFLCIYNIDFFKTLISSVEVYLSSTTHSLDSKLNLINLTVLKYIGISAIFLIICFFALKKLRLLYLTILLIILSGLLYFIIITDCFNLIPPLSIGPLFTRQYWFVCFLFAFCIFFWFNTAIKIYLKNLTAKQELAVIILIPSTVLFLSMSFFSALGILAGLYSSIPIIGAFTLIILSTENLKKKTYAIKLFLLIIILAPFYYTTAIADWEFTFFDKAPRDISNVIKNGFAKGIKTNDVYAYLYEWIGKVSEEYSTKNDFIISYTVSPMIHMIAHRRPAMEESWLTPGQFSPDYYKRAIKQMKEKNREPQLAYVFEMMPILYHSPYSNNYLFRPKQFNFQSDTSPVALYIKNNMNLLHELKLSENTMLRCFIAKKAFSKLH
jgi:hypothetical protein